MRPLILIALLALVLLPGCADDEPVEDTEAPGVPATLVESVAEGVTLFAELSGEAEDPAEGPIAGGGTATITIAGEELCFELHVEALAEPEDAHIHAGLDDEVGEVVVPLESPEDEASRGCVVIDPDVGDALLAEPSAFYVDVHSAVQDVLVRGQLAR